MVVSDSYRVEAEQRLAAYRELSAAIGAMAVTARSPDGSVQVTVRPGGAVSGLRLTDDALRLGADRLGRLVLVTIGQAQGRLATRLARQARGYVGERYDVVAAVRGQLPPVPPPAAPRSAPPSVSRSASRSESRSASRSASRSGYRVGGAG